MMNAMGSPPTGSITQEVMFFKVYSWIGCLGLWVSEFETRRIPDNNLITMAAPLSPAIF